MYDPSLLYLDPVLTNFSVGFEDQQLFGREIFPETPVRTPSGTYRVYDRSSWLIFEDRREPGGVANEIAGAKWSSDTFNVREHSLQAPITDEERQLLVSQGGLANPVFGGDLQIDPERDATNKVMSAIMLRHEKLAADTARLTTNYAAGNTVTLAGAQQWDDYTGGVASTSNPIADIMTGMRVVRQKTGRYPNVLAIPVLGLPYIENHPRVIDRFKNFALTMDDAFKRLTGFNGKIILVESFYNAANNVDATESITNLWGKDVWLGIVDPVPGQKTRTFGKTFAEIYPDGTLRPTERWREEPRKSDIVRSSYKYDIKIVSNIAAYLIKTAFSATAF